ncbi:MAG: DNA-binding protein [Aeromicrobium sp.]|jgi:hemolysin III|nr:DNA-binding protein [Aeromicrobium sp.]
MTQTHPASRVPAGPAAHRARVLPDASLVGAKERTVEAVHDRVTDTVNEVKPRLRGWLHAATAPLAFFSFLVVLVIAESTRVRIGVSVFMVSALLLFITSAVYHTGTWTPRRMQMLRRLDHANIFVLIAGSSTPFAMLLLSQRHAVIMLSMMWGGAALGVAFKMFWIDAPRWLYVPLYLLLGWAPIIFAGDFLNGGTPAVLMLIVAGGVFYSIGALVYGLKWPNPSPAYFGFHEVFHSFTIAAFFVHYVGVSLLAYGQR